MYVVNNIKSALINNNSIQYMYIGKIRTYVTGPAKINCVGTNYT